MMVMVMLMVMVMVMVVLIAIIVMQIKMMTTVILNPMTEAKTRRHAPLMLTCRLRHHRHQQQRQDHQQHRLGQGAGRRMQQQESP